MDTKAAGILGVCIVVAALIVSLVPRSQPSPVPGSQSSPVPAEVGHYQFARSNGVNCFVLDTKTGRLWVCFIDPSGGGTGWHEDKAPWVEEKGK